MTVCAPEQPKEGQWSDAPRAGWPKISLVTPNFNGARYIDRCIQSVLEQGYPNLEYFVIDGGSNDGSVGIIQKYAARLTYWVSEKDSGQANAINKGFSRATGDVMNWLCSDDRLLPGALHTIGRRFAEEPGLDVLVGGCDMRYVAHPTKGGPTWTHPDSIALIPCTNPINQPSCFFRRRVLRSVEKGVLDESYHYAMDTELWSYLLSKGVKFGATDAVLSEYLMTGVNKTMTGGCKILKELERLYRSYSGEKVPLSMVVGRVLHPLERYEANHEGARRGKIAAAMYSGVYHITGRIYGFDRLNAYCGTYRFFDPVRE